jgi:hypothetical protein
MIDRDLKPNSEERRAIALVLRLPPNKPLTAEPKALLWRFRYSLTQASGAHAVGGRCVVAACLDARGRPQQGSAAAAWPLGWLLKLRRSAAAVSPGLPLMRRLPHSHTPQDKRALTKFLKCVDWGDVSEASQVSSAGRVGAAGRAVSTGSGAALERGCWLCRAARRLCTQQLCQHRALAAPAL